MRRDQANVVRLVLMCGVWAAAEVVLARVGLFDPLTRLVVPGGLAAIVYLLTEDLGSGGRFGGGGTLKYWRGRRVDDDDKRRWN